MTWNRVEASQGNIPKLNRRKQIFPRKVDVLDVKVVFLYAIKCYGGVEVYLHTFVNLSSHGDEWAALCSERYFVRKEPPVSIE